MNKIIFALVVLLSGYHAIAQDPLIIEKDWYLHDLILNGTSYLPPTNVFIDFDEQGFVSTSVCPGTGGGGIVTYQGTTSFTTSIAWLAGLCEVKVLDDFNFLYHDLWTNGENVPYTYSITASGDEHTLIITSDEGNQGIYGTTLLGLEDFSEITFALFPNPTSGILNLQIPKITDVKDIFVYSLTGKRQGVSVEKQLDLIQLNTANLSSGIYFIEIQDSNGQKLTTRFVKN